MDGVHDPKKFQFNDFMMMNSLLNLVVALLVENVAG